MKVTEISSGIYQLKIPIPNNPLGNTNCYLLRGDEGYLIIDPGANNDVAFDSLQKQLSEVGVAFEEITQILATHCHSDHYGLFGRVKQFSPAKILVHQRAREIIQSGWPNSERAQQRQQWLKLNGTPSFELEEIHQHDSQVQKRVSEMWYSITPLLPDVELQDNETIALGSFSLKVLWTPGHSPDHICLYEPTKKILFSGDHVLPVITPHVSLESPSDINPLADFINSLNKVKQLDVNLVLPAHQQLFSNLSTRVEEIIQHHEQRNAEILATLNSEPKTAYQVSTEITWRPEQGGVKLQDLAPPWQKRMAISETVAHLKAMETKGKVTTFFRDDIIYHQRN